MFLNWFTNFPWPDLSKINYNEIYSNIGHYALLVLKALIILFIGLKVIKWITKGISKRLEKSKIDPSIRSFIIPLISVILKTALIITIISVFGIEVTSFVAILGSVGFAIGLAFQGSLANFAGGILILMLKPFKVGDYIEANGFNGTVKDIQIFYTTLVTPDNKRVIIPNAGISNSSLINYSTYPTRRLELKLSCSYDNDINVVKSVLEKLIYNHELVLKEPAPEVYLAEYGNNSINFLVRGWTKTTDFWNVYYDLMFKVKAEFDNNDIIIPYPQIDVHMIEKKIK